MRQHIQKDGHITEFEGPLTQKQCAAQLTTLCSHSIISDLVSYKSVTMLTWLKLTSTMATSNEAHREPTLIAKVIIDVISQLQCKHCPLFCLCFNILFYNDA